MSGSQRSDVGTGSYDRDRARGMRQYSVANVGSKGSTTDYEGDFGRAWCTEVKREEIDGEGTAVEY